MEPILVENRKRYTPLPIQHPDIYERYQYALQHLLSIPGKQQEEEPADPSLKKILSAYIELMSRSQKVLRVLADKLQYTEAKMWLGFMISIKDLHKRACEHAIGEEEDDYTDLSGFLPDADMGLGERMVVSYLLNCLFTDCLTRRLPDGDFKNNLMLANEEEKRFYSLLFKHHIVNKDVRVDHLLYVVAVVMRHFVDDGDWIAYYADELMVNMGLPKLFDTKVDPMEPGFTAGELPHDMEVIKPPELIVVDPNEEEPLLNGSLLRKRIYPIQNEKLWDHHCKSLGAFWHEHELNFAADGDHWTKLTEDQQHFLSHILAFFAASDGIVNENLLERFTDEVKCEEVSHFYNFQTLIENVHSTVYGELIETFIKDPEQKDMLFNAIETMESVKSKAQWAIKWTQSKDATLDERLIAFATVEGVFFSGSFAAIFWLKEVMPGLFPALRLSNDFISRDEGFHTELPCLLHNDYVKNKTGQERVYEIVKDAVRVEKAFFKEALPKNMAGMNVDLMCEYIEYTANRLVDELGYEKIYNVKQPFDFMSSIGLDGKTNFFESRVPDYQKVVEDSDDVCFDAEF